MNPIDLLPIFLELSKKFPELIFWKHFERGINGEGDIDTIAPFYLVPEISSEFIRLTMNSTPEVVAVVECRYAINVRPHFVVNTRDFPSLFQFDISWSPIRLSMPWCDTSKLVQFTMINNWGIRVLQPGALAVVLFMLYGVSRNGKNNMKNHDYRDMLKGLREDKATAIKFVESVLPSSLYNIMLSLINDLNCRDWSTNLTRKLWWSIAFKAAIPQLKAGPRCWIDLLERGWITRSRIHHHSRSAIQDSIKQYLKDMRHDHHNITLKPDMFG